MRLSNFLAFYNILFSDNDNAKSVDNVHHNFGKAFDKVPHSKLMIKVKQLRINGNAYNYIKYWSSR